MEDLPKELVTPTPQEVLSAMTDWYSIHSAPRNYHSRIAWIEREFRIAFGGSYGTVLPEQLPEAIDLVCKIIAQLEHPIRSATKRLEFIMEQIIFSISRGSSRTSKADAEALVSALQIARLEPDCPYTYSWGMKYLQKS